MLGLCLSVLGGTFIMKFTFEDKSTRQGVFLQYFIVGCFFNIFIIYSAFHAKYSNGYKNKLKWLGSLCGILFPFTFGLILIYVIIKYRKIKRATYVDNLYYITPEYKQCINQDYAEKERNYD